MGKISDKMHGLKTVIMMVFIQAAYAGMSLLYKLASNDGMNLRVLIAYRFLFAAATVVPLALYFDRQLHLIFLIIIQLVFSLHFLLQFSYIYMVL